MQIHLKLIWCIDLNKWMSCKYWICLNSFPHTTNLHKTTLKAFGQNYWKHLQMKVIKCIWKYVAKWELLVLSNLYFCDNVFKSCLLQRHLHVGKNTFTGKWSRASWPSCLYNKLSLTMTIQCFHWHFLQKIWFADNSSNLKQQYWLVEKYQPISERYILSAKHIS